MRNNLFYAMITAAFLMVGCNSSGEVNAGTTTSGDSLTGKAGKVVSSATVEVEKRTGDALAGSDTGR